MAVEGVMQNMAVGSSAPAQSEAPAPVAVEQAPIEAPAEAKPVEAEKPRERSSERFAALARKEAEVFRKAQAIRQQQAEIARQAEELKSFRTAKQQAALNPLDALKQLGLTYEQITEYVLNDNKPTPSAEVMTLKQEIEEFKRTQREEQEKLLAMQRERETLEQQETIEAFRSEVNDYISEHAETYELTNLYNGASLVVGVIEEHFRQSGRLMSTAEAAKLVEEHFEDLARKAQATKKFAATQQKAASPQAPAQGSASKIGPTLSNDLTAMAAAKTQSPRTDAERIAAAMARLEGR